MTGLPTILLLIVPLALLQAPGQPPGDAKPAGKADAGDAKKDDKQAGQKEGPEAKDDKKDDKKDAGKDVEKDAGKEDAGEAPAAGTEDDSVGGFSKLINSGASGLLIKGGWFMVPILLMAVVAAGVIIERYRTLKMLRTDSDAVRQQVSELMAANRVEEALEYCSSQQGPVPAVLAAGIRKFLMMRELEYDPAQVEDQVVKAMDDYSVHIVAALERHLPVLATVSSIAPMLGFLGTVAGMVTSFDNIVANQGEMNIVEAAAMGISQALLTTAFGLIVGIPAFMAFNYFTSIINGFVLDVEESATELIETVALQKALNK